MKNKLLKIFCDLVKIDTRYSCDEAFLYVKNNFDYEYEIVGDTHKAMILYIPCIGEKSIFNAHKCIAFCGHLDVVECAGEWEHEPFSAEIIEKNGDLRVFGRGTQDMKSGVAAYLATLKPRKNLNQIVVLISDEESDSISTQAALAHLEKKGVKIDFCLVSEPTCDMQMGDTIKVARRGSIHAKLDIYGLEGHVAYPQKCVNAVDLLSLVLKDISGYEFDEPKSVFEPSRIVINSLSTNTHVSNIVPSEVKLRLNVRNTTFTNIKNIEDYLVKVLDNSGLKRDDSKAPKTYTLELWQTSKPFLSSPSEYISKLSSCVEKLTGIKPEQNAKGGTSDARFFAEYGINTCEFGIVNDLIHKVNESASFDEVHTLALVIDEFLNDICD